MTMYAIKSPTGFLMTDTVATSRTRAWDSAYHRHLYKAYRDYENPTKSAYRRGYRCVKVMIIEIFESAE